MNELVNSWPLWVKLVAFFGVSSFVRMIGTALAVTFMGYLETVFRYTRHSDTRISAKAGFIGNLGWVIFACLIVMIFG